MNQRYTISGSFAISCLWVLGFALPAIGQDQGLEQPNSDRDPDKEKQLFSKFEKTLSGAKLIGNFTVLGQENNDLTPEEYHIKSVRKMPEGDIWMFTARIKYGGKDVSVPMPLEVKWAGDTPIITLDDFAVPGMGSFDARVVIHNNKYAGTWSHDDVGGHLFGTIAPDAAEDVDVSDDSDGEDDNDQCR